MTIMIALGSPSDPVSETLAEPVRAMPREALPFASGIARVVLEVRHNGEPWVMLADANGKRRIALVVHSKGEFRRFGLLVAPSDLYQARYGQTKKRATSGQVGGGDRAPPPPKIN
jgi:hypothetical protein